MGRKGSVAAIVALWGCANRSAPAPPIAPPYDRVADLAKATECIEQGDRAWSKGDVEQAHGYYRCAVDRRARYMLDTQKELIESRFQLASVLASACKLDEARELFWLVRSGARPSPRLAFLAGAATLELAGIAWVRGYRAEAMRLVREVAQDCERVAPRVCNDAHAVLAVLARSFPNAERPSTELLLRQLEAPNVTPHGRQFTRLTIYDLLRARPEPEAAEHFARENDIVANHGAPWPTGVFPTALECSAPLSWDDTEKLTRYQISIWASLEDCLKAEPVVDAERPPAASVTILLAPDGTTSSVEVAGAAVAPRVLECVSSAAQRVRLPAVGEGYRVYHLSVRLD